MQVRVYKVAAILAAVAAVMTITFAVIAAVRAALLVDSIPGADAGIGKTAELVQLQTSVPLLFLLGLAGVGIAIAFAILASTRKRPDSATADVR
jgi:hypothetical protein